MSSGATTTMKRTGRRLMRLLRTLNARSATEICFTFPINGEQCWHTVRLFTLGPVMKRNAWIAIKIWFIQRNNFTVIRNFRCLTLTLVD